MAAPNGGRRGERERGRERETERREGWTAALGLWSLAAKEFEEMGIKECGHDEVIWLIRMRTKERERERGMEKNLSSRRVALGRFLLVLVENSTTPTTLALSSSPNSRQGSRRGLAIHYRINLVSFNHLIPRKGHAAVDLYTVNFASPDKNSTSSVAQTPVNSRVRGIAPHHSSFLYRGPGRNSVPNGLPARIDG
ncbi:hypothetical protein BO94DRAFT_548293 [Aspergillus sclerotioniger CBS 115572]|uniref:Uncharacterized protein n=1 Tax=Aspergillus sclerotioniger CBS 115572 TaxID=1450535 RepID=A0A317W1E0_9EURO|nr:hypothetical protein BO94DRAFT_548293 [Aspergillus sclerotioniger CBS 115572]PWY80293.1 hypothetical protein BO94DRAFT_548293 [Aspergillus sclerotioniger CBS 115572]